LSGGDLWFLAAIDRNGKKNKLLLTVCFDEFEENTQPDCSNSD